MVGRNPWCAPSPQMAPCVLGICMRWAAWEGPGWVLWILLGPQPCGPLPLFSLTITVTLWGVGDPLCSEKSELQEAQSLCQVTLQAWVWSIANALDCPLPCLREMGLFIVPDGGCSCKGMAAGLPSFVMSTLELMPASGWFCPDNATFTHPFAN